MSTWEKIKDEVGPRPGSPVAKALQEKREAKKKTTPPASPGALIALVVIALVVGGGLIGYFFLSYAERSHRIDAINTVRGYEILDGLTIDGLVQDEVFDAWLMGSPKRAVWDAERETGGQYVVTLQFLMELPGENIYFHGAMWRVNVKTEEITPLDGGAEAYMGL